MDALAAVGVTVTNSPAEIGSTMQKVLAAKPDEAESYYQVAALCASRNDYGGAIDILKQAEAKVGEIKQQ
jgi:cytochrome c-type biogenesis protein CcmH/NrfG